MHNYKYEVDQIIVVPNANGVPSIYFKVLSRGGYDNSRIYNVAVLDDHGKLPLAVDWLLFESSIVVLARIPESNEPSALRRAWDSKVNFK